jgi:hypothetical protein
MAKIIIFLILLLTLGVALCVSYSGASSILPMELIIIGAAASAHYGLLYEYSMEHPEKKFEFIRLLVASTAITILLIVTAIMKEMFS